MMTIDWIFLAKYVVMRQIVFKYFSASSYFKISLADFRIVRGQHRMLIIINYGSAFNHFTVKS